MVLMSNYRAQMEIQALKIQNNLLEHENASIKRMCKFYKDNCELFKKEWFDTQFRYNTYNLSKDIHQTSPRYTTDTPLIPLNKPTVIRI